MVHSAGRTSDPTWHSKTECDTGRGIESALRARTVGTESAFLAGGLEPKRTHESTRRLDL